MKIVFRLPKLRLVVPGVQHFTIALLFLFTLFFPKGGVKIQGLPVTWGLLVFSIVSFFLFFQNRQILKKKPLIVFFATLPFQVIAILTISFRSYVHLADTVSLLLHFVIMPVVFLMMFPQHVSQNQLHSCIDWIKRGLFFIASFGIFLFFYKFLFGSFLEIPFLTVNYHDFHDLEENKCIDRGGVFKLISTYNNGNLYGICVLMLLPIYTFYETSFFKKTLVKSSLILTLSRTIWIGLIAYELLHLCVQKSHFLKKLALIALNFSILITLFLFLNQFFPLSAEFLFDRFFGNRIGQLEVLNHVSLFGQEAFSGVYEVVYLGILKSFGILGLCAFILFFSFPLIQLFIEKVCGKKITDLQRQAALGLFLYLLIAGSDGALLLIPVMSYCLFLIFLISLDVEESKKFE